MPILSALAGGTEVLEALRLGMVLVEIEGMDVGVVATGRIGLTVLRRMKPFDVNLHYIDRHRLPDDVEKELGATFHDSVESLVAACDVVSIHCRCIWRPNTCSTTP